MVLLEKAQIFLEKSRRKLYLSCMVVIRLARAGSKNRPGYRITVSDQRRSTRGRFIEVIGRYHPLSGDKKALINTEKYENWIKKGAQPSQTVANLYKKLTKNKKEAQLNGTQGNHRKSHQTAGG